ncbi:MAG TPA: polysaccharide biosynthesis C-terminal domain-containing protein, partial [Puia sp.]|nr:polysaccharide biosynthesis C-terminal domain-containing protein [Puia sp.]
LFRLFTTVLIVLSFVGSIKNFDLFIKLYACTYIVLATILLSFLLVKKEIHLTLAVSRVTRKFFKKILALASFVWSGALIYNVASVFDTIVIAAVMPEGLAYVGIFTLAQNIASLIQAPQRGIIAASIGPLSKAWKDKDMEKIDRIYHRSSINQLIFAVGMFMLIWINFTDGVFTFHLQTAYLKGRYVFLFLGLMRIIDMGTGVNSQIIVTSTLWRFEFFTGIILLALSLPLNYILTKELGVVGPAIATCFALGVYNSIRYLFLLKKYKLQPFTRHTAYVLILGLVSYMICHSLFNQYHGFIWIVVRTSLFLLIYLGSAIFFNLSPDIKPVWATVRKRFGIK